MCGGVCDNVQPQHMCTTTACVAAGAASQHMHDGRRWTAICQRITLSSYKSLAAWPRIQLASIHSHSPCKWFPTNVKWSWHTGRWWVDCYIWYSDKGIGRGPITASVPNLRIGTVLMCCVLNLCNSWELSVSSSLCNWLAYPTVPLYSLAFWCAQQR